ncbi:acyl-CoA dehydrogenase family protein [Nonomuraea dietziae]|uniref:Alkylation response protein AidB-like acyl-CoA dehydrogenase n=1 Tax=Nonomuraea dietziae TaxID=65515 RepID=A0A7W5YE80_9ACTN|nr:acyl-CoA dehydrogenase family protein [Nonomuraea dietziae]MBB3731378.1 alkylation response protein AidB-like acyl-CoA dehydrogenase [Nonomuraea dietziae]
MSLSELRTVVRSFLAAHPAASWARFSGELGVAGLAVDERYGGAGCGLSELAVVAEEIGRALSPHPFLQTAVMATAATDDPELLGAIAEGALTATVVLPGEHSCVLDGDRLTGSAPYVLDAEAVLLYVGGSLVAAEPSARVPYETMDASRPLTALSFDGAVARHAGDGAAWERVRDLAVIALAAEQVGGAARCLEAATAHARLRHQFGRPIGSFQAIKHRLAELLVVVESARSAVWGAVGDPSAQAAAIAGSYCGEAYLKAAGDSIQIHGGIGITWEHEAHRYFKRATSDARLFGPPRSHRARLEIG